MPRANVRNAAPGAERQAARKSNAAMRRSKGLSVNRAGVQNKAMKASKMDAPPPKRKPTTMQTRPGTGGRPGGGKASSRPTPNVGGKPPKSRGPKGRPGGMKPGGKGGMPSWAGGMKPGMLPGMGGRPNPFAGASSMMPGGGFGGPSGPMGALGGFMGGQPMARPGYGGGPMAQMGGMGSQMGGKAGQLRPGAGGPQPGMGQGMNPYMR